MFLFILTIGVILFRYTLIASLSEIGFTFSAESNRSRLIAGIAIVFPLFIGVILPLLGIDLNDGLGNRLLHGLGGGGTIAILLLSVLVRSTRPISFLGKCFLLLAVVSIAGVANEVLECILDMLGLGMFSENRTDTWYDLISNTIGAFVFIPLLYWMRYGE